MKIFKNTFWTNEYPRLIIICLLMICIFSSCNSQQPNIIVNYSIDSLVKDIPNDAKGSPAGFYLMKKEMEKMMGMDTLENGFDSMQIRIWYGVALMDKLQLLVLKKSASKWTALFYSLGLNYDKDRRLVSVSKNIEIKQPKSGWETVIDSLYKMNILVMPDSHKIMDYEYCTDGDGVTIEISTIKKYRIFNYPCFDSQKGIKEAEKIEQIMKLIENEFSYRRLTLK